MKTECRIERYEKNGAYSERVIEVDEASVVGVFDSLGDAWSATAQITGTEQELAISFSEGGAAVLLTTGEDAFYDLVASTSTDGWTQFVHGGQPAKHPQRHVVSMANAKTVAQEFLRDGLVSLAAHTWERQGEQQGAKPTAA